MKKIKEKGSRREKLLNYRKEIRIECTNGMFFDDKGTINFEFAILISIFFIALHAFFHRDLRLSVRTAGGTWARGTVDCSMRPIDQCLIQPALTVRKGSYPLSPSSLLPSSFNSLFYPLSPRATVKSLRRSVFGAISSYN